MVKLLYPGDQIKNDDTGEAHSIYEGKRNERRILMRKLKETDNVEDHGVDGNITLDLLKKYS
jgi:hypothetical protein